MNQKLQNKLIKLGRRIQLQRLPNRTLHITFILNGNRVVCYGLNDRRKTHPLSGHQYRKTHSELEAILEFPIADECKRYHIKNLRAIAYKYTLVNIRLNKLGEMRMAMPCKSCQIMLEDVRFKNVYYSTQEGAFNPLNF